MMKRIIAVLITAVFMLQAASCTMFASTTQKYLNAVGRTEKADTLQSITQWKVTMDLSRAQEDTKKRLEKFKEVTLNIDGSADNKNDKGEVNLFYGAGEMMLNAKIYANGGNLYVKSSVTGDKYIRMTPEEQEKTRLNTEGYTRLFKEMGDIWKNGVEKEILVSEGNSMVNTPDGDIKVTQLSLELTDEKSKNILGKLAEVVSKSQVMKETVVGNMMMYIESDVPADEAGKQVEDWLTNLPGNMEKNRGQYVLNKLKLTAKIDRDSFIIEEALEGSVTVKWGGEVNIDFRMNTTRWNINSSAVKVNIPEMKKEDLMDMKDLKLSDSNIMKAFMGQSK